MEGEIFRKRTGKDIEGLSMQEINKVVEEIDGEQLKLSGTGSSFDIVDEELKYNNSLFFK